MDQSWASVQLLLRCNGSDASTTFEDLSNNGHTVTAVGDAQVDTGQSKFGGASLQLDGSGDRLSIASSSAFGFGTGAWTVEAWVRPSSFGADRGLFDFRPGISGAHGFMYFSSTGRLTYYDGATVRGNSGTAATANTWVHVAFTYDGTTLRAFLGGVLQWSAAFSIDFSSARPLVIGANYAGTGALPGHIDDIRITGGVARYTSTFAPPEAEFPEGYQALVQVPGVLDEVQILGYMLVQGRVSDSGALGAPQVLGALTRGTLLDAGPLGAVQIIGRVPFAALLAASPLGSPRLLGLHDFTGQLGDTVTRYVLDITTEDGTVRAPISSWQATLQTGAKSYVQCVVPACEPYVDDITAATSISIKRLAELPDGSAIEYEMASAPTPTATLSQGPFRYTATLTAYADAFAEDEDPPETFDRRLDEIRSLTTTPNTLRARCAVDWLLRPGQRAIVSDEQSIVVAFINYYVNENDQFMDVGNRAA